MKRLRQLTQGSGGDEPPASHTRVSRLERLVSGQDPDEEPAAAEPVRSWWDRAKGAGLQVAGQLGQGAVEMEKGLTEILLEHSKPLPGVPALESFGQPKERHLTDLITPGGESDAGPVQSWLERHSQDLDRQQGDIEAAVPTPEVTGFNLESVPGFAAHVVRELPATLAAEAAIPAGVGRLKEGAGIVKRIAARAGRDAAVGLPYSKITGRADDTALEIGEHKIPGLVADPLMFAAGGAALEAGGSAIRAGRDAVASGAESLGRAGKALRSASTKGRKSLAGAIAPELKDELRGAQRAAETDKLTGLANRDALDKALPAAEADPETGVAVFDANNFGQVNKGAGGQAGGDRALQDVAAAIKQAADEHGVGERVFRRGGDEFVVLGPHEVIDKVRTRAEELFGSREHGGVQVSLTGTKGNTFAEADATLQAAKKARKAIDGPVPQSRTKSGTPAPTAPKPGTSEFATLQQWTRELQPGMAAAADQETRALTVARLERLIELGGPKFGPARLRKIEELLAEWKAPAEEAGSVKPAVSSDQMNQVPSSTVDVMKQIRELGLEQDLAAQVAQRGGENASAAEVELAARTLLDDRLAKHRLAAEEPVQTSTPEFYDPPTAPQRGGAEPPELPAPLKQPVENTEEKLTAQRLASRLEREVAQRGEAAKVQRDAIAGIVRGSKTDILAPSGNTPAHYAVVESANVIPSHNPHTFEPDPRYPAGVQERQYHRDPSEQLKVRTNASKWDPRYVLSDDPSAVNGPPIMLENGIVLGGNSRTMSMQLQYSGGNGAAVKKAIGEQAARFGIDPAAVDAMREPVLVRVVEGNPPIEQLPDLVRRYNEPPTQALSSTAAAVAQARRLSDETMSFAAGTIDPEETISSWLRRPNNQKELIARLRADGVLTPQNINQFAGADGYLNQEGRAFVERLFLGKAVPDADVLDSAPAGLLQKIEKAVMSIARAAEVGGEWDLRPQLSTALKLARDSRATFPSIPGEKRLAEFLAQHDMFGAGGAIDPDALTLWQVMEERSGKEIRAIFSHYAEKARLAKPGIEGQVELDALMGPPPTPQQAFKSAFVPMKGGGDNAIYLGAAGGIKPELAGWLVRGTIGATGAALAVDPTVDRRTRAIASFVAIVGLGPIANRALASTGLHPGEAVWRVLTSGGDAMKDWVFNQFAKGLGEAEAHKLMQFFFYEYGMPKWLRVAMRNRETETEVGTRRVTEWVRDNIVKKFDPEGRARITGVVRQVEQVREGVTREIERVQALYRVEKGARQQSQLWHEGEDITDGGLLSKLQALRTERDQVTAQAWASLPETAETKVGRELVTREDALAQELINEGYDPDVFERFKDAHLVRQYEKWLSPEEATERFPDLFSSPDRKPIRDATDWMMRRQDLPPAVRAELGEIHDAAVLFAKGQGDKVYSLATRKLYNQIAEGVLPDGLPLVSRTGRPGYVKLPDTEALGPLAGKWAHGSVAWSLKATLHIEQEGVKAVTAIKRGYLRAFGAWKGGKTAWSPWTVSRNIMSNGILLHLSGMDVFSPKNVKTFTKALIEYAHGGKAYEEAASAGVFTGSQYRREVQDLLRSWHSTSGEAPLERIMQLSGVHPGMLAKVKNLGSKPGQFYGAVEHAFKFAKYLYNREQGLEPTAAAEDAVSTLFDYGAIPPVIRWYRNSPLGAPFVTFTYKAVPKLAEWSLKHPDKWASMIALFAMVENLQNKEPLPEVSEDLVHPWLRATVKVGSKLLRLPGVPFTGRQALQIPLEGERGQGMANLQYLLPYGGAVPDVSDPQRPVLGWIPPAVRPSNPVFNIPYGIVQNRDAFTGRPIVPEAAADDPPLEKAKTFAGYAAKQLAPNIAQVPGFAIDAAKGEIPWSGFANQMLGTKPVYVDAQKGYQIERNKIDKQLDEIRRQRFRDRYDARKSGGRMTPEEAAEINQTYLRRKSALTERRRIIGEALQRARAAGYTKGE